MKFICRIIVAVLVTVFISLFLVMAMNTKSLNDMKSKPYAFFASQMIRHTPILFKQGGCCNTKNTKYEKKLEDPDILTKLEEIDRCFYSISVPIKYEKDILESYFRVVSMKINTGAIIWSTFLIITAIVFFLCIFSIIIRLLIFVFSKPNKFIVKTTTYIFILMGFFTFIIFLLSIFSSFQLSVDNLNKNVWKEAFFKKNITHHISTSAIELNTNELIFKTNLEDKNKTVTITPYDTSNNQQRIVVSYNKKDKKLKWVKEEVKSDGKIELIKTWKEKAY